MKEYTTKEMKPGEPEIKVEATLTPDKALIEEKRGRYYVKDLNGKRLGVFLTNKDAKEFVTKL
tara:strand:- start:1853 stop:2041 length:189 start_codon:yes stop_codon:yes gene_type:complete